MIGKNPLWVAKQHGHRVTTMFRVYSAWAEGALEVDSQALRREMKRPPAAPLGDGLAGIGSALRSGRRPTDAVEIGNGGAWARRGALGHASPSLAAHLAAHLAADVSSEL
jgi:hypothetical protein